MGCIVAIDHGTKKTGFALADALRIICEPLDICNAAGDSPELLAHIVELCRERDVERFVIGLPRNMDGTEGPRAEDVRAFGERLLAAVRATGLPVPAITFWDERLSTKEADSLLVEAGYTGKDRKSRRDSWAALVILRDWLEAGEPES
jgi:putative Holliday junction resolvase